jgi:tetratricopeptide (TPR) repeat protein
MEDIRVVHVLGTEIDYAFETPEITALVKKQYAEASKLLSDNKLTAATAEFKALATRYPEYLDSWIQLANCYTGDDLHIERLAFLISAVTIGKNAIPADFDENEHHLPWHITDNQPYLRACLALGSEYMNWFMTEEALAIFQHMLKINPTDDLGIRELITACYLDLEEYDDLIAFYNKYKDTASITLKLNYILANVALGKENDVKEEAKELWPKYQLLFKGLLKDTMKKPKTKPGDVITEDGPEVAYEYYAKFGLYWCDIENAMDFLLDVKDEAGKKK